MCGLCGAGCDNTGLSPITGLSLVTQGISQEPDPLKQPEQSKEPNPFDEEFQDVPEEPERKESPKEPSELVI